MFRVEVIGNVGADAVKKEDGGRAFFTFKVAHSESWEDANGNKRERTTWVSCIASEKLGEAVSKYLTKGRKVYVRGRASLDVYSSKIDRCMKAGCSVSVDELELLGGSSDDVPRRLINPDTNTIHDVHKAYYCILDEFPKKKMPAQMVSEHGSLFATDKNGFVFPQVSEPDAQATD